MSGYRDRDLRADRRYRLGRAVRAAGAAHRPVRGWRPCPAPSSGRPTSPAAGSPSRSGRWPPWPRWWRCRGSGWRRVLAVLTGLLSPVAAAFLGFVAAVLVLHRKPGRLDTGHRHHRAGRVSSRWPSPVAASSRCHPGAAMPGVLVGLALGIVTDDRLVRTASLLYAAAVRRVRRPRRPLRQQRAAARADGGRAPAARDDHASARKVTAGWCCRSGCWPGSSIRSSATSVPGPSRP